MNISRGARFLSWALYVLGVAVFLIGVRFGLVGGALGGVIAYLAMAKAKKLNPEAGKVTEGKMQTKHVLLAIAIVIGGFALLALFI